MGPDYHYKQIDKRNRGGFNAYLYARCQIFIQIILKLVLFLKKKVKNLKILDVGCGDGVLLYLLNKNINKDDFQLHGIDSSKLSLNVAKAKNPNVKFQKADVYDLPFVDNLFDLIVSSDVIEHLLFTDKMLYSLHLREVIIYFLKPQK